MSDPNATAEVAGQVSTRWAERFTGLFACAPVGIALLDDEGVIAEANDALAAITGRSVDSLRATPLAELAATSCEAATVRENLTRVQQTGTPVSEVQIDLAHPQDERVRMALSVILLPADAPGAAYPVAYLRDITEQQSLREHLLRQNVTDVVTGLPNQSSLTTTVEAALGEQGSSRIGLVYFDLDGFRLVGDAWGTTTGDHLLRAVGNKLRRVFNAPGDEVARLAADGFGVLMRGELSTSTVIARVDEALAEIREPVYIDGAPVGVGASAGIAVADAGTGSATELERKAEVSLHRAKYLGRARWVLYEPESHGAARNDAQLAASLAGALENGEFELLYEPTVTLDDSESVPVVNAELRWHHPQRGTLPPAEFLRHADATGMTVAIGRWVISQALAARGWWQTLCGPSAPDLCLRLPRRVAIEEDLVGFVTHDLKVNELDASVVRLCVSAGTVRDPRGEARESFEVLRNIGTRLVLEVDAATDLDLIREAGLPADFIVLSAAVTGSLLHSGRAQALRQIEHVVAGAAEFGMRVGAEGIRTAEQARTLAELGVSAARGPYFSAPISGEELATVIQVGAGDEAR